MKKTVILSFIALSITFTACNSNSKQASGASDSTGSLTASSTSAPKEDAPVIEFDKDSYDFGKITDGDKVTHVFKFTNTGKTPLIIQSATATCGCTTPEYPKTPIAPGEDGEIKVTFDSLEKVGKQRKVITINSNADPAVSEVYLVGEVLEKK